MDTETEETVTKVTLDMLKNPKTLIAAAIAALGGVLFVGDGFTIEFSTCAEEPKPTLEVVELEATEPEAPEEAPEEEPEAEQE